MFLGVSGPKNEIFAKSKVSHKKSENWRFRFRYSFQTQLITPLTDFALKKIVNQDRNAQKRNIYLIKLLPLTVIMPL